MTQTIRACLDCRADISDRRWNATRCVPCAERHAPWEATRERRTMYDHACEYCGKEFTTRVKRQRFCSGRCSGIGTMRPATERTCQACGSSFTGRVDHCSRRCYHWIRKNPGGRIPTRCGWCGDDIRGRTTAARFCSRSCAAMTMISRRRARKDRKPVDRINPVDIFERDRWVCHICAEPIDRARRAKEPTAPALDHLIPVAHPAYPGHIAANLAAAHWGCNTAKGARMTDADLTLHLRLLADLPPGEPMKRRPWSTAGVQTHCINGHEFTDENTYWRPDGGGRQCRQCIGDRQRKRYAREDGSKRLEWMAVLRAKYDGRPPRNPKRSAIIRAWAQSEGMPVPTMGRLPNHVIAAYETATREAA